MRGIGRALGLIVVVAAAAYLAAVGYLFLIQRDHVFQPSGELADPAALGSTASRSSASSRRRDAARRAGTSPPRPASRRCSISTAMPATSRSALRASSRSLESGFGVLAMSYRGFAGSGGSPSETALFSDALEIFDWLAARSDRIVAPRRIARHRRSPPMWPPSVRRAALVLEAPFTAALDIAAATYPWVPVSLLMRDPFLSRDHIRRVDEPVHHPARHGGPGDPGRAAAGGSSKRPTSRRSSSSSRGRPQRPVEERPLADRARLPEEERRGGSGRAGGPAHALLGRLIVGVEVRRRGRRRRRPSAGRRAAPAPAPGSSRPGSSGGRASPPR